MFRTLALGLILTTVLTTSVAQTCTVLKNTAFGKPGFQDLNTTDPDRVSLLSLITASRSILTHTHTHTRTLSVLRRLLCTT